ncbi:MAG TPA: haloacid dehalogenase type II [Candidatus Limnocylindrales bacterium]|nr:haloacid dehalogenase type II [Candidatus Limnocylindrales bacterium]
MSDSFDPKFVTFDCYGTLTNFQMGSATKRILGDRLPGDIAEPFLDMFGNYRLDEVMGSWRPYRDVIAAAYNRACAKFGIEYRDEDATEIYQSIGTWGPHPDVPAGLAKLATKVPLVILSNATDSQIAHNVALLGAPFHRVLTAEQAQAYKPRYRAFEYMLDTLGVDPTEIVHVSASLRYDLMPAYDLGITNKVYVNRGYEFSTPEYGYREITTIAELPGLFGL